MLLDVVYRIPWPSSHPKGRLDRPRDCSEEQRIWRAGSIFISAPRQSEGVGKGLSGKSANDYRTGATARGSVTRIVEQGFMLVKAQKQKS